MLTRKHFEAIAQAIAETKLSCDDQVTQDSVNSARDYIAREIADICKEQNPRFDRERFLRSCEV